MTRKGLEENAVGAIAVVHAALHAAGREAEAQAVLAAARASMPGPCLEAAVEKVLGEVDGRPDPSP